ncbi:MULTISPECIES: DUF1192 domain-containing protein [Alphaproteobacteria]|uniref:DUF1192 domain-containing protein n=2 Tax=Alphaproteobacteria TaxID=28211 RepID=A0A512HPM0_9HYPH|nr:DUF1192 domain-containing protein [Sphingomonas psychrolutea]GEO87406.1 hypothetical protein RNA01_43380 [Ciceribacter naphthalenivorans]GLR23750.1 hypothetical protein GCM10007920_35420 [Ciceribacter naphthalenivorans]GLT06606.1 hypothetical protein GCM10007926_35420 [Sphingomonas psychrolutea]
MIFDEDKPKKPAGHEVGCDLSALSSDELQARIMLLQAEIERIEAERIRKETGKLAADNFFKPKV